MQKESEVRQKWFIQMVDSLEGKGVTQADIANELEVSPQYINAIYKGRKNASEKFIAKFCKGFSIDHRGLVNALRSNFEKEFPIDKEFVIDESKEQDKVVLKIPLVSTSAVAGFGNAEFAISESDVKDYYVVPKFKDRRVDFMIEVSGSSMYPKYSPGDVVACTILKESQFIQWNKVHVIGTVEQGILIKRIKKGSDVNHYTLVSDNKDYDAFEIPTKEITGIAIVVGVIRLE